MKSFPNCLKAESSQTEGQVKMGEGRSGQVTMVRDLFSPNNPLFLTCSPPRLDLIHLSQAEISLQLQCAGVT